MSCYFRHMKDIFEEAGIRADQASRRKLVADLRARWKG